MRPYPPWFKRCLLLVLTSVLLTGLLLMPTSLLLRAEIELPWHLASGQRVPVAAWHAGSAMLTAVFAGALWTVHMRAGWRKRRQRVSGALLCAGLATLMLTSLVIYYSGEEATAALAVWIHLGVGIAFVPPFVWHAWLARSRNHGKAAGGVDTRRKRSRRPRTFDAGQADEERFKRA